MEARSMTPDGLIRNFVFNARDLIQCAECRALTDDPVQAGCDHTFCRSCLDAKFKKFDTQESFTVCPVCKTALPKQDIKHLTPKSSKLSDILQRCVIQFCDEATLDLDNYVGQNLPKVVRTYSKRRSEASPVLKVSPDLGAKEKVEEWLMKNKDSGALNGTQETVSTESFACSSSYPRSLASKESYDIVPAPSPPPVDDASKRRRGKGRGRGQRKSALPISSGDRSDAKRARSVDNTPESNRQNDSTVERKSVSPTFDLLHQRARTSTPVLNSTPLTAPRRRGRARRPASAMSERPIDSRQRIDLRQSTGNKEKEEEPVLMEVDLFEPSSPENRTVEQETEQHKPLPADNQLTIEAQEKNGEESQSQTLNEANSKALPTETVQRKQSNASLPDLNCENIQKDHSQDKERAETSAMDISTDMTNNVNNDNEIESEVTPEPFFGFTDVNAILPDIPPPVKKNIVDYSESSGTDSTVKDTTPKVNASESFERLFINFFHKGRLVPKKTVLIKERKFIPFVKKGKFEFRFDEKTVSVEPQQHISQQKSYATTSTQTPIVHLKESSSQTTEKKHSTIETQTESTEYSHVSVQTDAMETEEVQNGPLNSNFGEVSEPIERKQSSRESSPDIFNEHSKRVRKLSSSSSGTAESEPKRRRATFEVDTPEFQTPAPPAPPAPPIVPAEDFTSKTVIMESDQESDSLDILAPTPPRKVPQLKRVFTCSSLQRTQVKLVQDWAKKIGADVVPTYTPAVTHVIVQVDNDNCAQRTLKFLYGVAAGKWIVSIDWVHSSMRENCVVDEELFEALDMEGESGPCRSRMRSKSSKLFQSFEFCCLEPFTDVTAVQLRELLEMSGATCAATPGQMKKNRRHALIVVQTDDTSEADVQKRAAWSFDKYQVLSVSREWVLDCLAAYKLMPVRAHLIGKHSESFLRMLRFDEQIVA